jgi:hypothetical protein
VQNLIVTSKLTFCGLVVKSIKQLWQVLKTMGQISLLTPTVSTDVTYVAAGTSGVKVKSPIDRYGHVLPPKIEPHTIEFQRLTDHLLHISNRKMVYPNYLQGGTEQ